MPVVRLRPCGSRLENMIMSVFLLACLNEEYSHPLYMSLVSVHLEWEHRSTKLSSPPELCTTCPVEAYNLPAIYAFVEQLQTPILRQSPAFSPL